MNVEQVMSTSPACCDERATLGDVARVMWENDCGVVPVVDARGTLIGMVSDRDVCMAAYTRGQPLVEIPVRSAMSTHAIECHPKDTLRRAEQLMIRHQLRRLPVVNRDGKPVGILSVNDLLRAAHKRNGQQPRGLTDGDIRKTLAAISMPPRDRVYHARAAE